MKLTTIRNGKPVEVGVVPNSAGTARRFKLPLWARVEMVALEDEIARLRNNAEVYRRENANLSVKLSERTHALQIATGAEKIDVVISTPKDGVTTYFVLDHNRAFPVFGTQPGDKILLARKPVL